jgi:hypothetical protein
MGRAPGRYANATDGKLNRPNIVVKQVKLDSRLERLRLVNREFTGIGERLAWKDGDLLVMLRPEAAVGPSALSQTDDTTWPVRLVSNVKRHERRA